MTGVIARYMTRIFLARCLAVLVALAALLQLLDLLDAASAVLERGGGFLDLGRYAALRLPVMLERLVPLAVLIGSLVTLWGLAQNNEVVAMRSAGLTPYQLLWALVPAAAAVAVFHLILADQIAPRAERAFFTWWAATEPPGDEPRKEDPLWLRVGENVVSAQRVREDGQRLEDVRIFVRDEDGRVTERLTASVAVFTPSGWQLEQATRVDLRNDARLERFDELAWDVRLHPANVVELTQPVQNIPFLRLRSILRGQWSGNQSPAYYQTRLHETYSGPLASLVMLLLAAPVAHGLRRRGGAQGALALGISIGLVFLLADGLLVALGEAGVLPPVLAAWGPTLFFTAVGGAILVYVEG
ncbi:LPS export ABC transporter permease LptG [Indioceanicola profundi]|uniref:LPS export ABC transporter permease LptG n=1 Tax=Indioceanicola profundi TaxID=2220096 RepID=UPI0013C4F659|nr:LPS export ABC transporter permease LptG [Indioceanicola profundi]